MDNNQKYLKYKKKYFELKNELKLQRQKGGNRSNSMVVLNDVCTRIKKMITEYIESEEFIHSELNTPNNMEIIRDAISYCNGIIERNGYFSSSFDLYTLENNVRDAYYILKEVLPELKQLHAEIERLELEERQQEKYSRDNTPIPQPPAMLAPVQAPAFAPAAAPAPVAPAAAPAPVAPAAPKQAGGFKRGMLRGGATDMINLLAEICQQIHTLLIDYSQRDQFIHSPLNNSTNRDILHRAIGEAHEYIIRRGGINKSSLDSLLESIGDANEVFKEILTNLPDLHARLQHIVDSTHSAIPAPPAPASSSSAAAAAPAPSSSSSSASAAAAPAPSSSSASAAAPAPVARIDMATQKRGEAVQIAKNILSIIKKIRDDGRYSSADETRKETIDLLQANVQETIDSFGYRNDLRGLGSLLRQAIFEGFTDFNRIYRIIYPRETPPTPRR